MAVDRPFRNYWGELAVDGSRNRFVGDLFKSKWAGVVARAIRGVDRVVVVVVGSFWDENAQVDVEGILGEVAIARVVLGAFDHSGASPA